MESVAHEGTSSALTAAGPHAPLLVAVLGLGLVVPLFSDPLGLVHHEDNEGLVLRRREERLEEEAVWVEVARVLERLARDGHEVADGRAGGDDVLLDAAVSAGRAAAEEIPPEPVGFWLLSC